MATTSPLRAYLRRAGVLTAAALVVNLLLLGVGTLAGASFTVPPFNPGGAAMQVGAAPVVAVTLVALVLGFAVAALPVARRAPRAVRALQVLGAAVALLSVVSPLLADTDATTRVVLALMHVVAGAAYVLGLQPHTARTAGARGAAAARS